MGSYHQGGTFFNYTADGGTILDSVQPLNRDAALLGGNSQPKSAYF